MKKLILMPLILLFSCTTNHQYDGQYYGETYLSFWISEKIHIELNGDNITIDNSITGSFKYKCCQYQDRIEYFLPNKVSAIIRISENGELILNDEFSLKRIDSVKTNNDSIQSYNKAESDDDLNAFKKSAKGKKSIMTISSDVETQYALIKDIRKEKGHVYIVLDYVQVIDEMGNTKNDNPKLRTFLLSDDCEIMNLTIDEEITIDNIDRFKANLISTNNNEKQVVCTIKNGLLTYLV